GQLLHRAADVDDVVGDHAEADPALHSDKALVAAAAEPMPAFDDADAPFAAGAPLLAVAEPALLLLAPAFRALGRAVGDADAFDTLRLRGGLVSVGIERGIRRDQAGRASQQDLMPLDRGNEDVRIVGALRVNFVIDDDLVLGLLQLHHLAELVRLGGL